MSSNKKSTANKHQWGMTSANALTSISLVPPDTPPINVRPSSVPSTSMLPNVPSSGPSSVPSDTQSNTPSDTKLITISMTRANKILAKMRDTDKPTSKRLCYDIKLNYGMKVKLLSFNRDAIEAALKDMEKKVSEKLLKKSLVEKWKNRLFELNVRHGVNTILSEIDTLKYEVSTIKEILEEFKTHNYGSLGGVIAGMGSVANYEKRYDLEWNVTTFNANKLRERLAEIEKRLSELDDKKDKINIENAFSIHLTADELKLLNL